MFLLLILTHFRHIFATNFSSSLCYSEDISRAGLAEGDSGCHHETLAFFNKAVSCGDFSSVAGRAGEIVQIFVLMDRKDTVRELEAAGDIQVGRQTKNGNLRPLPRRP